MRNNQFTLIVLGVAVLVIVGIWYWSNNQTAKKDGSPSEQAQYNPVIDPSNFVSEVNNKYFTLKPGTTFTYNSQTDEGLERIEVVVTNETKEVMGVKNTVVWDRVFLDNQLIEDTKDWYAQDKDGNVWYFGEDVDNYENGKLKDHHGAWEAGVDEAKPGIVMLANPQVGDSYRQEYYRGEAEDTADVLSINETLTVKHGSFSGCIKTYDYTPLDPATKEHKYYCPEVGFVVLEQHVGSPEKTELVSVSS